MRTGLNLATRRYYDRRKLRRFLYFFASLMIVAAIAGIVMFFMFNRERDRLNTEIMNFDKRLAGHPEGMSDNEVADRRQKVAAINKVLEKRRIPWLQLLDSIEAATPSGVAYTQILPDDANKNIKLAGKARNLAVLSNLLEKLGKTGNIRKPILLSTTSDAGTATAEATIKPGINFTISFVWERR